MVSFYEIATTNDNEGLLPSKLLTSSVLANVPGYSSPICKYSYTQHICLDQIGKNVSFSKAEKILSLS
jgi:hypothetical protein